MRVILFFVVITLMANSLAAQSGYISQFYDQYRSREGVDNVQLSGFMLRLAGSYTDKAAAGSILRKVSYLRLLTMSHGNLVSPEHYTALIRGIRSDGFEELLQVREGRQRIEFFLREDGHTITDVLLLLHGEDQFLMLSLEGALKFSDLRHLQLDIEGGQHFSRLPERRPKA